MVIVGSPTLISSFTNLGLIDEYRILVHPVLLGSGKPLFTAIAGPHKLKLVRSKAYDQGAVLLVYQALA